MVAVSLSMCNVYCFGGQKESHTIDTPIYELPVKNKKLPDHPAIFTLSFFCCNAQQTKNGNWHYMSTSLEL